jgi:2-polyprenyl-3-methyl-5-hydroxy-6-metoxy-1,4-benzoquinol methylase
MAGVAQAPRRPHTASPGCQICGCTELYPAFSVAEFTVIICVKCGHGNTAYAESSVPSQARFAEARWTETRDMLQHVITRTARHRYEELLPFAPGRDILEVGCGTGEFLGQARQAGHRVTGVDLSRPALSYARSRYPGIDVRCQPLEAACLAPASFDVVAAFHVLEHMSDPVMLLCQLGELLRPGGLVYIRVPNLGSWYRRVLGRSWWGFSIEHQGHFTELSLRTALAAAGLTVLMVRSGDSDRDYSYWPVLPLLFARGRILRSVGDALQPPRDCRQAPGAGYGLRFALKRHLLSAYMSYRRTATLLIRPFCSLQERWGGAPELVAVGRKPLHDERAGQGTGPGDS